MINESNIIKIFCKNSSKILQPKNSSVIINKLPDVLCKSLNEIPSECLRANFLKPTGKSLLESIRSNFEAIYNKLAKIKDFEPIRRFKSDYYFKGVNEVLRHGEESFLNNFTDHFYVGDLSQYNLKICLKECETLDSVPEKTLVERLKQIKAKEALQETKEIVSGVDTIFDHSIMSETTTVYRGIGERTTHRILSSENGIFEDKGFISTSYYKNRAKLFGGSHILEIEVPKGSKAIDMKTALPHAEWKDWEDELLLPRNSRFEVVNYDEQNKIVKLRLVNLQGGKPYP